MPAGMFLLLHKRINYSHAWCLPCVACCTLHVPCLVLPGVCCMSRGVACCVLYIACFKLPVVCHATVAPWLLGSISPATIGDAVYRMHMDAIGGLQPCKQQVHVVPHGSLKPVAACSVAAVFMIHIPAPSFWTCVLIFAQTFEHTLGM